MRQQGVQDFEPLRRRTDIEGRRSNRTEIVNGGGRGIRTPGSFGSTVFKTAALNHSAIPPFVRHRI